MNSAPERDTKPSAVFFLIDYFPPHEIGGAERSTAALARALGEASVSVTVLALNFGANRIETVHGVHVRRLPFPERLAPGQLASRRWMANPVLWLIHGLEVAALMMRSGVRVLHVQSSQMLIPGALSCILSGRRLVVTIRDLSLLPPDRRLSRDTGRGPLKWRVDRLISRGESALKRWLLNRADVVVFVSESLRNHHQQVLSRSVLSKSRVVHNIGPSPRGPQPRAARRHSVLYVGKQSYGKGLDSLYAAAIEIAAAIPEVTFDLAGLPGDGWRPPPEEIHDRIVSHGRVPESAVADLMDRATVLVSPSIWPEPLSRVLLEAMSRGLPIVATNVGGTSEMLDSESAWLVEPADAKALARAVIDVLRNPAAALERSNNASQRLAERFSKPAIVKQMIDVYRTAI